VDPECGDLACGWKGRGRLAEASEIYFSTMRALGPHDLAGKRIVISTGPTREAIDPVRFISNRSSGKMGVALAREAYRRGGEVTLVHGPLSGAPRLASGIKRVPITSAGEMHTAQAAPEKIKKSTAPRSIELEANADILSELGRAKGSSEKPFLVGFAVETGTQEGLLVEVKRKLSAKNADLMIGNLAQDSFDRDTNRVCLVPRSGEATMLEVARKREVARAIFDAIKVGISR
jgi:phosphopantothenoylcysteine decarboxylase / phosphopantothenate---cysteine ligase